MLRPSQSTILSWGVCWSLMGCLWLGEWISTIQETKGQDLGLNLASLICAIQTTTSHHSKTQMTSLYLYSRLWSVPVIFHDFIGFISKNNKINIINIFCFSIGLLIHFRQNTYAYIKKYDQVFICLKVSPLSH